MSINGTSSTGVVASDLVKEVAQPKNQSILVGVTRYIEESATRPCCVLYVQKTEKNLQAVDTSALKQLIENIRTGDKCISFCEYEQAYDLWNVCLLSEIENVKNGGIHTNALMSLKSASIRTLFGVTSVEHVEKLLDEGVKIHIAANSDHTKRDMWVTYIFERNDSKGIVVFVLMPEKRNH